MRFEGQRRHFIPSPVGTKRFYGSSVRPPVTPLSRSDIPSVRPSDTICHVFVYIDNSRYHSLSNSKTTNSEMRDGRMSPQWQFPTSTRAAPLFQREIFERKKGGTYIFYQSVTLYMNGPYRVHTISRLKRSLSTTNLRLLSRAGSVATARYRSSSQRKDRLTSPPEMKRGLIT